MLANRGVVTACWMVRLALAALFPLVLADRLRLQGPPGSTGVSLGSVNQ